MILRLMGAKKSVHSGVRTVSIGLLALVPVMATLSLGSTPAAALKHLPTDDTTYTLQRTFKPNEVDHVEIVAKQKVNSPMFSGDIIATIVMKETTKDVKPNGNGVILQEFESAVIEYGEQKIDAASLGVLPQITQTRDKTGRVLDTKVEGGNEQFNSQMVGSQQQQFGIFPDKPVKIGDSWKVDMADPKAKVPFKSTGTATLTGLETLGGVQTVKIKVVSDSEVKTSDQSGDPVVIKTHFEGVSNIDPQTGKILRMVGKSSSMGGPAGDGEITYRLKSPDEKKDEKKDDKKDDKKSDTTKKS